MSLRLDLDWKQVEKGLKLYGKNFLQEAQKGMAQAGFNLLRDCVMERPTVPLKEGTLRGSGSVIVNGKLTKTSPFGKKGTPATSYSNKKAGFIIATVGFNTPYAKRLHEHPNYNFSEPSSGGKYLEKKLVKFKKDYIATVVDYLKKVKK